MQVLSLRGPADAVDHLVDRLAPRLDGTIAFVEGSDGADGRTDGGSQGGTRSDVLDRRADDVSERYTLTPGGWIGSGEGRTLEEVLDELAPRCDYALVTGFPDASLPTVALGEAVGDVEDLMLTAEDGDTIDFDDLAAQVDDLEPHVTLEELVRRAKASPHADLAGAIATFTGRVRAMEDEDDSRTTYLEFEMYENVAEQRLSAISEELRDRDGVFEVLFHHRTGVVPDGEDIVFVVVLAGHREEAFRTVEDGINRLKDEVPIFKKETTVDEKFWVHDRT